MYPQGVEDEEPSVKKGRHRRYEEARKFQRDTAAQFTVEDFDFDAPDPFSLSERDAIVDDDDDEDGELEESGEGYEDEYDDLAAKYADFDTNGERDDD